MTNAPEVGSRAERLYRDAIVVDLHNDLPTRMLDDGYDAAVRHAPGFTGDRGHTDVPRLAESGITVQFLAAWVDAPFARAPGASFARAMQFIDAIRALAARHPDRLLFGTRAADAERAKRDGRVALFIGVEGGHAIEGSLDRLRELYERGARYLTLTWNNGNAWAGSSIGAGGTRVAGLTRFGRSVVREMHRLGMLVDLSHVSDSTFFDVLAVSEGPVIVSHSNARALCGVERNLTDEQLRAVAGTGGVVGVNFYSRFLDPRFRAEQDEVLRAIDLDLRAARAAGGPDAAASRARVIARRDALVAKIPPVPFAAIVDHLEHLAAVAGVDHVALGSDFDGVAALPAGMEDVTAMPRIAEALLDRGWRDDDVRKVLGANAMRVLRDVLG